MPGLWEFRGDLRDPFLYSSLVTASKLMNMLHWEYMGILEKKMETTIVGYIGFRV